MKINKKRLEYWNSRSKMGFKAGSGDTNLKKIEIEAIYNQIKKEKMILDAGCGNAYTLVNLAKRLPHAKFYGFDYAEHMIKEGLKLIKKEKMISKIKIFQWGLLNKKLKIFRSKIGKNPSFDIVFTERALINLNSLKEQTDAIKNLWSYVASGGRLILCESFEDGLKEINLYRKALKLRPIKKPWHNRYLNLTEIIKIGKKINATPNVIEFSGSYYFTSRVLHAKEAFDAGKEPSYGAPININSLNIPPLPVCGQSKIIIFKKF